MYDGVASRVEYWIDLDWRRLNLQLVDKYIDLRLAKFSINLFVRYLNDKKKEKRFLYDQIFLYSFLPFDIQNFQRKIITHIYSISQDTMLTGCRYQCIGCISIGIDSF